MKYLADFQLLAESVSHYISAVILRAFPSIIGRENKGATVLGANADRDVG